MTGVNYGQGSNVVRCTLAEIEERKGMNSVHIELCHLIRLISRRFSTLLQSSNRGMFHHAFIYNSLTRRDLGRSVSRPLPIRSLDGEPVDHQDLLRAQG